MPGSPAINAGDNSAPGIQPIDFEEGPSIIDGIVNLGAIEALARVEDVPTLSQWGMIALMFLMGAGVVLTARRRVGA